MKSVNTRVAGKVLALTFALFGTATSMLLILARTPSP